MITSSRAAVGRDKLTREHVVLVALLAVVIMFEGFDVSLTSVVLPYIGADFGIPTQSLGRAVAAIALGAIAATFVIRLADRYGRRPVLLVAAGGFSLGCLLTVAATGLGTYIAIQFATRVLMVTLVSLAYIIVSETLPANVRGRANGLLGAVASIGAALPFLLLDAALDTDLGWRLLFLVGAAPLLILPILLWKVRETPVWSQQRGETREVRSLTAEFALVAAPGLRARFAAMSTLWFIINFASAASTVFFTLYVTQERGWAAAALVAIAPLSLLGAFAGYVGAGLLADAIGRKPTIALFLLLYGAFAALCYSSQDRTVTTAAFVGLQAMLGVWMVSFTLNSELFPTDLRAAANGWSHNMIGRWGAVVAPWLVGELSAAMGGVGPAGLALAFVPWFGIPLVLLAFPETRGARLDRNPLAGRNNT